MSPVSRLLCTVGLLLVLGAGCTANHYRKSADRAAYSVIKEKSPAVTNMDPRFTIEQTNTVLLDTMPANTNVYAYLGADGEVERGARKLRLQDALALAVENSRNYQSEKERLYNSALQLTLARHQFTPIFSGRSGASYQETSAHRYSEVEVVDEITGQRRTVLTDNIVENQRLQADGTLGASWLIRDLGKLTTSITESFTKFSGGDWEGSATLAANIVSPLLQNAGFKREKEALIQAERDLLYDIRDFTRFRKDFSVQIATTYYRVLGLRDSVRNSYLNLETSRKNAERSRALALEGRTTQSDLGRFEQQVLSSEGSWINAVRNYKQALDNFKIQLGLRIADNIVLDDTELEALAIKHPTLSVDDSIQVALVARLDLMNTRAQLEDAGRKVALQKNNLKPKVDLVSSVVVDSDPGDRTGVPLPDEASYAWEAGLDIDLGLDKTSERNAYRSSLISSNQASRAVVQKEDEIRLEVRNSWRTLDQAKRSYEISETGVRLAERRVEEQDLLAELGRARALDQVDAQNALIESKNERTQALVTHTIARLEFWNNMGILYIKDNGHWEEVTNAQGN